jgi:hypothetical protein
MSEEQLNSLLLQIIDNSKYKSATPEQKNLISKKLVQKYLNDINQIVLDSLNPTQKQEFSEILATQDVNDINNYIAANVTDIEGIAKKASEKFSEDVYTVMKE